MTYEEEMGNLLMRRRIAKIAIAALETTKSDPRYPEAIKKYTGQLEEIEQRIEALKLEPHDIVIGLKPAKLTPQVSR